MEMAKGDINQECDEPFGFVWRNGSGYPQLAILVVKIMIIHWNWELEVPYFPEKHICESIALPMFFDRSLSSNAPFMTWWGARGDRFLSPSEGIVIPDISKR